MNIFNAHLHSTARVLQCVALSIVLIAFLFACALTACTGRHNSQPTHPEPQNKADAADVRKEQSAESRPPEQSPEKAVSARYPFGKRIFRARYTNGQYGYSVTLPKGLVGTGPGDPAPDHGIVITLSEQPKAHIVTSGLYNGDGSGSGGYASIDEAIDSYIKGIKEDAAWLEVLGREPARLHDLPAVRAIIRYQDRGSGQVMIDDSITAFRTVHFMSVSEEIMYAVGLSTPEARYAQDKVIYEEVVRSWRTQRVTE